MTESNTRVLWGRAQKNRSPQTLHSNEDIFKQDNGWHRTGCWENGLRWAIIHFKAKVKCFCESLPPCSPRSQQRIVIHSLGFSFHCKKAGCLWPHISSQSCKMRSYPLWHTPEKGSTKHLACFEVFQENLGATTDWHAASRYASV